MADRGLSSFFSENRQFQKGSSTTSGQLLQDPQYLLRLLGLKPQSGREISREGQWAGSVHYKCAVSPQQDTATHYLRDRLLLVSWIEALGEKLQVPPLTKRNPLLPKCLLIISSIQDLTLKSFCYSQDPPNMSFIPSHKFVHQDVTRPSTKCAQRCEAGGL